MSTPTVSIGDRARVTECSQGDPDHVGRVGVFSNVDAGHSIVEFPDDPHDGYCLASQIIPSDAPWTFPVTVGPVAVALTGLRERLAADVARFSEHAASANPLLELRLNERADGVRLALSYVDEMLRAEVRS